MTQAEYKAERKARAQSDAAAVAELMAAAVDFEKATAKFAAAFPHGKTSAVAKTQRAVIWTVQNCVANIRAVPVGCVSICINPPN